jgi:hypothetical protein
MALEIKRWQQWEFWDQLEWITPDLWAQSEQWLSMLARF